MNLVKDRLPLPLYKKSFETIFNVGDEMELNQELLWILPKSYTITSIGLHTTNNHSKETGKSSFLNYVFLTNFELANNKQTIIQRLPFIAIRVFQDLFPLNIIDIPR